VHEVTFEGASAPMEKDGITLIESEEINESNIKVFNLEVADWHTYFVGLGMCLVHNAEHV
jgi:hypothetical protein